MERKRGLQRDLRILSKKINEFEMRLKRLEENEIPHLSKQIVDESMHAIKKVDESTERFISLYDNLTQRMDKHLEEHEVKKQTLGERLYDLYKSELEKEHFDKVVAFDIESGTVAGIGDTVSDAYNQARKKLGEKQYYFKRIGRKYLFRLR